MVDFNSDATVGRPPADILKILMLQRRADLFEALETYNLDLTSGVQASLSTVRARLNTLFLECSPSIKSIKEKGYKKKGSNEKEPKKEETMYDHLNRLINSKEDDDVLEAIEILNDYLYKKNITKWDNLRTYDETDIEAENKNKGM